jgi:hypothetical protein
MHAQSRRVAGSWLIVIFVVSFFSASSVVALLLQRAGLADKDIVDAKYRQAIADPRVNLIFLGASLVDTGFNPVEFDAAMRMRDLCTYSYNLGIGGMTIPEVLALLKRLQASNHVHYILLAPTFWLLDAGRFPNSIRSIDYFDLPNALTFAAYVSSFRKLPPWPSIEQKEYLSNIAIATFRHYTNIGLARLLLTTERHKYYYEYNFWEEFQRRAQLRGQSPSDRFNYSSGEIEAYQLGLRQYAGERERLLAGEPAARSQLNEHLPDDLFAFFMRAVDIARAITPNVIAVEPPTTGYIQFDLAFVERLRSPIVRGPPLLDFSDPREYPELFELGNRYDGVHLNAKGAVAWSRLLADRLAELIKRGVVQAPDANACAA